MQEDKKVSLLEVAKGHLSMVREKIETVITYRGAKTKDMQRQSLSLQKDDAWVQQYMALHNERQVETLKQLYPSPYFTRCDFVQNGEKKEIYVGKFSFGDQNIYSWVASAATLRFETPGPAGYTRPDGNIES